MKFIFSFLLFLLCCYAFAQKTGSSVSKVPLSIPIKWNDSLTGNFSFAEQWSYPPAVEIKQDGRPGCADGGFCPQRCYAMLDENGIVKKDSEAVFYSLLDTNHIQHSIQCETSCSEFIETNVIDIVRKGTDSIFCRTATDISTHCILQLVVVKNNCSAISVINSIVPGGNARYVCTKGQMIIDKKCWDKGILKAVFNFDFVNEKKTPETIYWKGKIYGKIRSDSTTK